MELNNDGQLDIAIGRSRQEKRWLNKEMQWSAFVTKCLKTHRTAETYEDYMKSKPAKQDIIKDIGGFVGGVIVGGRRKATSIVQRQLLTLDLDFCDSVNDLWDLVLVIDKASCVYSTHKHCIDKPRLRLLMPLNRPVNPDEYEAISRKMAAHFNIEWFDPTTFQPSRLMYWPSTSIDGDFYSNVNDSEWLDADEVLAEYKDWQDSTQWPVSSKTKDKIRSNIKEQGDPLKKDGLVGAWCRTYTMEDVIDTHLSDVYIKSDMNDRYTYVNGSTANGLAIYDDKFAFSHHATDPISEKLCNAFDIVRLHKFAHLDEKHDPTMLGGKLPSFVAMSDFVSNDPATRRTIGAEKLAEAKDIFADDPNMKAREAAEGEDLDPDETDAWMEQMEVGRDGNYMATINNIVLILENDPGLKNAFKMNEFEHREELWRDLPWRKVDKYTMYMTDADASALRHYMELIYGITSVMKIEDALVVVLNRHKYHPVRDWLNSFEWDGKQRAETIFIRYLGADDNSYVRGITRKALLACVARIFEPGIKFDEMHITIGDQGIGKSTILRRLGNKWFSDSLTDVRGKDALEQLQGAWIIEFGELSAMKRAEIEHVKHFQRKQEDRFRVSYGRRVETFPRQCVFWGTTNIENPLKDMTGNRSFWPMSTDMDKATENVFARLDAEEVGQIWAEVMCWYIMGENLYLDNMLKIEAKAVAMLHLEIDERIGALQTYLDTPVPANWDDMNIFDRRAWLADDQAQITAKDSCKLREFISAAEVWCELLGGTMKDMSNYNMREVHGMMRRLDDWEFTKKQRRMGAAYGRQIVYKRSYLKPAVDELIE